MTMKAPAVTAATTLTDTPGPDIKVSCWIGTAAKYRRRQMRHRLMFGSGIGSVITNVAFMAVLFIR